MAVTETLFGDEAAVLRRPEFRLLLLATFPIALGVGVLSPILETLTGPFGVSPAAIGLLVTSFFGPAIVVTPIAGTLADRLGRKPLLVSGLVLFGAGGVAIASTTDFRLVLAYRLGQGVGSGLLLPTLVTSIGDLYDGEQEAAAQGFRTAVHSLSGVVAPVVSGLLVVAAWQYPFLIYAVTFPIALLVLLRFEEPLDQAADAEPARLGELVALARRPAVLPVVLGIAVPSFLVVAFMTFNSILVVRGLGATPGTAGVVAGVGSLAIAIGATQAGRVTAAFASRSTPLLVGNLSLGVGLAGAALAPSVPLVVAAVALLGAATGLTMSLFRSVLTGVAPGNLRGGLVSLGETSRGVGAATAPVVVGALVELTQADLGVLGAVRWMIVAVAILGAAVGIWLVARTDPTAAPGVAPAADP